MLEKFKASNYNKHSFIALRKILMAFYPYPEGNPNPNFVELEKQILAYWEDNKTFEQSIANRRGCPEFVFYDGPPFANGMPHYGHLLTGFAKDAIARFQTMLGKKVERRFGWDCHGLPAEMSAEKELNISGKKAINQFGIAKFNQCCKESVMRYANSWRQYVNRQARWVDFDNDYKTMDTAFMESVIWGFKELYKKGLVYKSTRVMPYSWACETPLSNFETRMDNAYRQKISKAATICFKARHPLAIMPDGQKTCFFVAWTTTPWTLPSNLALAVHRGMQYTAILHDDKFYICALSCVAKMVKIIEKNLGKATLTDSVFSGESLLGTEYVPQFDFFAQTPNAFRVLHGDFVSDNDGTGIVHCAPGFGEDDLEICLANKIPVVCPIDDGGRFTKEVPLYQDKHVFDTNDSIIMYLKQQHLWLHTEQYLHQYPHCWRTDTPLIYRALPSWYIKVTAIKDRMVELNQNINWLPVHIRDGLFGKWLENARDWSISRKRFWGTPIPIWESDNPAFPRIDVYGSIAEIEQDFKTKIPDLHRPFIDRLVRANPDDPSGQSQMRRVEDVFDCWFESGSMPYAQKHYPFENKQWFNKNFPADFIVEYVAQTRGWFYTLMVLSTALFDSHPFRNCICHGVVLDQKGQKLSKRLNNYTDPLEVMEKYGSDALRFLMLSSSIMSGGTLLLDKDCEMVRDALRLKIKPIWNAYCFFAMYANTEQIMPELNVDPDMNVSNSHKMDFYILNKCKEAVRQIKECLSAYDTVGACAAVELFFEVLNNWYIRRNKKRFIEEKNDDSKQNAYNTLYSVLHVMCRAICPLLPFVSECVYKNLTGESVHLQDFPVHQVILASANAKIMQKLNDAMDEARDICNAALSVRNVHNIRIRQPLNRLTYFVSSKQRAGLIDKYMQSIIEEEVNVKEFVISYALEEHAKYKLQMVFAEIGKRIPESMKDIIAAHKKAQWQEEPDGLHIGNVVLQPNEYNLALEPLRADVSALSHNHAVVLLDTTVDEDLLVEGIARDLVRLIQETRKQHGFRITDKVVTYIATSNKQVAIACHKWSSYIKKQTCSTQLFVNAAERQGPCAQYKLMDDDIGIFLADKSA